MSVLAEHVRVLSTAPWFDPDLGSQLISLVSTTNATEILGELRTAGVTVERHGVTRIAEPLRSEYRRSLCADDLALYYAALNAFADHALSGDGALTKVMGTAGLLMNARAIAYVAKKDDEDKVAALINLVQLDTHRRESHSARAAANVLSTYLYREDRLSDFFTGLDYWLRNRRIEAVTQFVKVLETDERDKATCVAGHLVAVQRYDAGDLSGAERYLDRAIAALRALNDRDGLMMTLTTLGRVKRERFRNSRDLDQIEASRRALEEARSLIPNISTRESSVLQPLAMTYLDLELVELALATAQRAVDSAPAGEERVSALVALATIYRAQENTSLYEEALNDAILEADIHELNGIELARLLNVQAGSERRIRNFSHAAALAGRSLAIGRKLNNERHIAHAAHTLAATYVDQSAASDDLVTFAGEIDALLKESRSLLVQMRDGRGVEMIDRTASRWRLIQSQPSISAPPEVDSD